MKPQINPTIRKYMTLGVLGLVMLILIYIVFTYTIVTVSADTPNTTDINLKIYSLSSKKTKDYRLAADEEKRIFVKRGAYNITANQGHNQTISSFVAKWFSTNQLVVTLKNENSVSRIATGSLGCGKLAGGTYYSYRCGGDIKVFKHIPFQVSTRASTTELSTSSTYRSMTQVPNGLVGLIDDQEGGVILENMDLPSEKTRKIAVNNQKDTDGYSLTPNGTKVGPYQFALVNQTNGTWLLYKNTSDVQPVQINTRAGVLDIEKYNMINESNQLKGTNLVALYDVLTDTGEGKVDSKTRDPRNRNLVTITDTTTRSTTSYNLPDSRKYESAYLSDATHLVIVTVGGEAIIYDVSTDKAVKVAEYDQVSALSVYNNTTLIAINRGIYKMSPDGSTIYRLFESEHLTLSSLSQDADGVEFAAYVNERSPLYTLPDVYRLTLDKKAVYPQDQATLPYTSSAIQSMDYNDSQIYIQLNLESLSFDRATNSASYDSTEFQRLANQVRAELSEKNLIRGRQLVFGY